MYRIQVTCDGVPAAVGPQAAIDIGQEFQERHWHKLVSCTFEDGRLSIEVENDFDPQGLALLDEFSDAIVACIEEPFEGDMKVESVVTF